MGLDMYLELRNGKKTVKDYQEFFARKSLKNNLDYYHRCLDALNNAHGNPKDYLMQAYPTLLDDRVRVLAGAKDPFISRLWNGRGYFAGGRPSLHTNDKDNPRFEETLDKFTPEELADIIFRNDLERTLDYLDNHIHPDLSDEKDYYSIELAYWRKANAIHAWFITHGHNTIDDVYTELNQNDLKDLKATCDQVLNDFTLASKLLPVQSGFFFGPTEYGEWYKQDLTNTIQILEEVLNTTYPIDSVFVYIADY